MTKFISVSRILINFVVIFTNIKVYLTNCEPTLRQQSREIYSVEIDNFMVFTKIKYRYAKTMVFCQMHNPNPSQGQEALFILELPEDAFISNFTMEINGKQYKSFIKERKIANETYTNAQKSGNTAGIVNKNEDDYIFHVTINLAANSSVLFFLEYEEEIPIIHNGPGHNYQYALSLIPQIEKVKHFCVDIDILEYKPFTITSPTSCNKNGKCVNMELKTEVTMFSTENKNRTRIIWEPTKNGTLKELSKTGLVGKFKLKYHFKSQEPVNDIVIRDGYIVHRFDARNFTKIPLFIIFVLDISDSMAEKRGQAMKQAMGKIFKDLNQNTDFFHIITFSSNVKHWIPKNHKLSGRFYPASSHLKMEATEYVNQLVFDGSTNIHDAMIEGLETAKNSSALYQEFCQQLESLGINSERCSNGSNNVPPTPMIFFLTDGTPTSGIVDGLTILKHVQQKNEKQQVPIFSIGLGNTANHSLLKTLSIMNHGIARKIYNDDNVEEQLEDFYNLVSFPVAKNVTFRYACSKPSLLTEISYDGDIETWLTSKDEIVVIGRLEKHWGNKHGDGPSRSHLEHDHGFKYEGYTAMSIGDKYAEFKARICQCGICPSENDKNSTTGFLYNFKKGGTFCPRELDEDDTFMERFWVHKILRKLIRYAISSGNETTKQEIIDMSKRFNLVTPFTSLISMIPKDSKGSNSFDHNSPFIPEIMKVDSISPTVVPQNNNANKKYYYGTSLGWMYGSTQKFVASSGNNPQVSLLSYFKSLQRKQQEQLAIHQNSSSSNVTMTLNINDIKWAEEHKFSLQLKKNRKNVTDVYQILKNATLEPEEGLLYSCKRALNKKQGKCVHLVNCIESEYLTDLKLFVKDYFCPIIVENIKYVGTCCTTLDN